MANETAAERFEAIVVKTVKKLHRTTTTNDIKDAVKDLSFIHEGLKLKEDDPSYDLRFEQVVKHWNNKTQDLGEGKKLGDEKLEEIKSQLQERLKNKDSLYVPDSSSLQQSKSADKCIEKSEQVLAYVTTISKNEIFVKPEDNGDELKVDRQEIPFGNAKLDDDDFFNPGDEVQVDVCDAGRAKNLTIIKCSECPIEWENFFITTLKEKVLSEDTDAVAIFNDEFERCKGIWNYIKEDEDFLKKEVNLKDFLTISAKLAERLVNRRETSCKTFLDNVSSSSFFINYLPNSIEKTFKDPDSNESHEIKTLLNLIAEFCPLAAKRVLKVASSLAKAVVRHAEDVDKTHGHKNCFWGIELLTSISTLLTKSIPGSEEIDLSNAEWYDLPTILTRTELYEEPDITSLQPIKKEGSYNNLDEYLETYHNLLREECYRNLHAGIRNFIENPKNHDPKKMNMYRIKLGGVIPTISDISIMLNCELCGEQENDESNLESHNLIFGSLMCISIDKTFEKLIWATVGHFPKEEQKNSNTRNVYVELCSKRNKLKDSEVLLKLHELTEKGEHALMAESPTFFQAFGPSLESLKKAKTSGNIPFQKEIISCEPSKSPDYTVKKCKKSLDWSIIFEKPMGCEFQIPEDKGNPVDAFKFLKENVKSKLDQTQLNAIQKFLENRVTLIQGPPGTGKSFLGGKILRLMLSMEIQKRYKGPILVMTYKNYALDHFMNMCLEFCPNAVRIGRSNENTLEQVKKINLTQICREKAMRKDLAHNYKLTMSEISRLRPQLKKILSNLMKPRFTLDLFLQAAETRHVDSLLSGLPGQSENSRSEKCELDDEKKKELLKKELLKWLPKKELDEKYNAFMERKNTSKTRDNTSKKSSKEVSEISDNEAMDPKVLNKERLQNADESYEGDMCESEDDSNSNNGDINEPLAFVFERDVGPSLAKLRDVDNVWDESVEDRVDFIYALQRKIMKENIDKFTKQLDKYIECLKDRKDIWEQYQVDILKKHDVIGMTITGAAMRSRILSQIKPCAVIIEEAAEILEGQLVSVLPPSIQHLVMLGDQEQLKPAVSCYDLKRYKNLDCSMFERLINNNLDHQQLGKQFRMKDDIAQLLRELNIYKVLETDLEKTGDNHPPKCIGESMFFWNHTNPEQKALGTSRSNPAEIRQITEVASHLLKHDYSPDHITVLCAYRGQVARMSASFLEKSKDPEHASFTKLKDIKITTVDSFQGEENKVILLSLVRSGEGDIGFMKEKNRICVAMSRAKCALYIFGNASHFEEYSRNWKKILEHMRNKKLVGKKLILKEISEKDEQLSSQQPDIQIYNAGTLIAGDYNTVCVHSKTDCNEAD